MTKDIERKHIHALVDQVDDEWLDSLMRVIQQYAAKGLNKKHRQEEKTEG